MHIASSIMEGSAQGAELSVESGEALAVVGLGAALEDPPETQSLVCRGCAHRGVVGGHHHVQDALGMAVEVGHLAATRVTPQTQLVLTEPVRTEYLLVLRVPQQSTHLTLGVDCLHELACLDVPEPHGLV